MTDTPQVPFGTPSKLAYLVRMDEDVWLRLSEGEREDWKEAWELDAREHNAQGYGLLVACLQLIPDPIFPSTEKTTPYVGWQISLKPPARYFVESKVSIVLAPEEGEALDPMLHVEIRKVLAQYPRGTHYEILSHTSATLDEGRTT